jgi:hypothetical protein
MVNLKGDVRTSGAKLTTDGSGLASILDTFLRWEPQAPRSLTQLVNSVAGLCRLLRDEVGEALKEEKHTGGPFTSLAADWRELLFPDADEDQFADGYAQTVTFALLLARVERIDFTGQPISEIARQLGKGRRAPRRSRGSAVRQPTALPPQPVTSTVQDITGHAPRSIRQWALDHADAFRS